MAREDIDRLKEKLEKDPNSKLFVPLAEEYKKEGMFDEAIEVLNRGLERHPDYMSARVSLGKIYLERGMLEEARAEFENVIQAIPDNLYAHKRLAEVYRDLGEKDNAIREFKIVLNLNPMDEWAMTNLTEIEKRLEVVPEKEKVIEEETTESQEEVLEQKAPVSDEEEPEEIPIAEEVLESLGEITSEGGEEVIAEAEESISREDEETIETLEDVLFEEQEEKVEEVEPVDIGEEFKESGEDRQTVVDITKEKKPEEVYKPHEAVFNEVGKMIESDEEISTKHILDVSDADRYISQEKYIDAMKIYKQILSIEPDNVKVMQRIEELKALLKLLGKDKEQLLERLDKFLEGIKKRRNEFFRNT